MTHYDTYEMGSFALNEDIEVGYELYDRGQISKNDETITTGPEWVIKHITTISDEPREINLDHPSLIAEVIETLNDNIEDAWEYV